MTLEKPLMRHKFSQSDVFSLTFHGISAKIKIMKNTGVLIEIG